jgi:hypothetical protein
VQSSAQNGNPRPGARRHNIWQYRQDTILQADGNLLPDSVPVADASAARIPDTMWREAAKSPISAPALTGGPSFSPVTAIIPPTA